MMTPAGVSRVGPSAVYQGITADGAEFQLSSNVVSILAVDLVKPRRYYSQRIEPVNLKNANHGIKTGKCFFTKTLKYVVKTCNKLLS